MSARARMAALGMSRRPKGGTIYVASGSAEPDISVAEEWIGKLRLQGFTITHDWTAIVRAHGGGSPRTASDRDRLTWVSVDIDAVCAAETLWLIVPTKPSFGAGFELGIAHITRQANSLILVSGDWRSSIFTSVAHERFDTHERAFEYLTET